jgi:hypothetical protein
LFETAGYRLIYLDSFEPINNLKSSMALDEALLIEVDTFPTIYLPLDQQSFP